VAVPNPTPRTAVLRFAPTGHDAGRRAGQHVGGDTGGDPLSSHLSALVAAFEAVALNAELISAQDGSPPLVRVTHQQAPDDSEDISCRHIDMGSEAGPPRLEWWFTWASQILLSPADRPDTAATTLAQLLQWRARHG
jgi:hypothetical protein